MTEYLLTISNNPEKGRWWVRGDNITDGSEIDRVMDTWEFLKWIATIILEGEKYVGHS